MGCPVPLAVWVELMDIAPLRLLVVDLRLHAELAQRQSVLSVQPGLLLSRGELREGAATTSDSVFQPLPKVWWGRASSMVHVKHWWLGQS